jgi:sec-independent protein translocase protein TatA
MTAPLVLGLGVPELLIILAVVLLLFGGSRLAGLGKSTGRALKEFKEETKGLKADDGTTAVTPPQSQPGSSTVPQAQQPASPPPPQFQQPPPSNLSNPDPADPEPPQRPLN